jgi:hypothetical protein
VEQAAQQRDGEDEKYQLARAGQVALIRLGDRRGNQRMRWY